MYISIYWYYYIYIC